VAERSSWSSTRQGFWKKQAYEKILSHVKQKEEYHFIDQKVKATVLSMTCIEERPRVS
jgi:hypothetical protein